MGSNHTYKVIIAEQAPIISSGLCQIIRKITGLRPEIYEIGSKATLMNEISSKSIHILLANPTFGGIFHPEEIRKASYNPTIKIFAIEYGKLYGETLSLFDGHVHITDGLETLSRKLMPVVKDQEEVHEKDTLSSREKEIISLVVKGFTNQEIADRLYLSIHTVITHRRNIARKLEIHSATGLTIYAIVNKIVDLSEIKI